MTRRNPRLLLLGIAVLLILSINGDTQTGGAGTLPPWTLSSSEDVGALLEALEQTEQSWRGALSLGAHLLNLRFHPCIHTGSTVLYFGSVLCSYPQGQLALSSTTPASDGLHRIVSVHDAGTQCAIPPGALYFAHQSDYRSTSIVNSIRTELEFEFLLYVLSELETPTPGSAIETVAAWLTDSDLVSLRNFELEHASSSVTLVLEFVDSTTGEALVEVLTISAVRVDGIFQQVQVQ